MVTDAQVRLLRRERMKGKTQVAALPIAAVESSLFRLLIAATSRPKRCAATCHPAATTTVGLSAIAAAAWEELLPTAW